MKSARFGAILLALLVGCSSMAKNGARLGAGAPLTRAAALGGKAFHR